MSKISCRYLARKTEPAREIQILNKTVYIPTDGDIMVNHSPIINLYANAIEVQHCDTYNVERSELYLK